MMPESWSLKDKVAIVTGGARGIGLAAATLLRDRGARVVASDLSEAVTSMYAPDVATLVGDVADEATAQRTVALAIERFGRLDILVNNAGRTLNKSLLDTSVEDWDTVMAVNARGYFLHSREAVRAMLGTGGGTIINVASIGFDRCHEGHRGLCRLKGRHRPTHQGHGRRLRWSRHPGECHCSRSGRNRHPRGHVADSRSTLASYGSATPIGRVAQATDIAELIGFLASSASSFMTGSMVVADGGYTAL